MARIHISLVRCKLDNKLIFWTFYDHFSFDVYDTIRYITLVVGCFKNHLFQSSKYIQLMEYNDNNGLCYCSE